MVCNKIIKSLAWLETKSWILDVLNKVDLYLKSLNINLIMKLINKLIYMWCKLIWRRNYNFGLKTQNLIWGKNGNFTWWHVALMWMCHLSSHDGRQISEDLILALHLW